MKTTLKTTEGETTLKTSILTFEARWPWQQPTCTCHLRIEEICRIFHDVPKKQNSYPLVSSVVFV